MCVSYFLWTLMADVLKLLCKNNHFEKSTLIFSLLISLYTYYVFDILLMQSFNPYPNGSDMHFKVSFSSSRLFLESLLSNEPVSWGFYSFGKYFFTYFLKSLYQVCDSCSIWVTDSILPEILISFCFWFLKI